MKMFAAAILLMTNFVFAEKPSSDQEIDSLLASLRRSGCRFQRNGSWYESPKAADHLATKRDYFAKKGKIKSPEDFIRLAGTESSMTGKAYRVACPERLEVDSKTWLIQELRRIRHRSD